MQVLEWWRILGSLVTWLEGGVWPAGGELAQVFLLYWSMDQWQEKRIWNLWGQNEVSLERYWYLLFNLYTLYFDLLPCCRHERYLGMWVDDVKCGPGMVVTSSGTYCEATFANGAIAVSWSKKIMSFIVIITLFPSPYPLSLSFSLTTLPFHPGWSWWFCHRS